MSYSEKSKTTRIKSIAFIDYKPAELKINKDWMVVYYSKNPLNGNLSRFRLRVPTISNRIERIKHGKRIVLEINNRLADGWSPFFEENGKNFKSFSDGITEFLNYLKKQVKDKVFREDTLRCYNSNLNLLQQFIREKKISIKFVLEINKRFCVEYLDWIYIDRNSSPRTRNNHLGFLKLFCNFLVNRGALSENPTTGIIAMKLQPKKRAIFTESIKEKIYQELEIYTNGFKNVCMTTYFCFVRNQELAKLFVKNVDLEQGTIFVSKEISKNKKDEYVTIPLQFLPNLKHHLKNANPDHYLFSSLDFKPGNKKMPIRKIATAWEKLRTKLNLESKYQFYSFKDTGITDLLNSGVPAIKVRDQARHYDIKITEMYTPRNTGSDATIRNANIIF